MLRSRRFRRGIALAMPLAAVLPFVPFVLAACAGSSADDTGAGGSDFSEKQVTGRSLPAKTVALTFDDGPGERTKELSAFLKSEGIHVGFFMLGNAASGKDALLKQVNADGHVIGNHTFDHKLLTLSSTDPLDEVKRTDAILSPFYTGKMHMFRAPFGGWSPKIADSLNNAGFSSYVGSIFWDIGGELTATHAADWDCWGHGTKANPHKPLSVEECGKRYLQEIHDRGDRGVVLMHDIHSNTVDMVKTVIVPELKRQGFKFARIDGVPDINAQLIHNGATPGPLAATTAAQPASPPPPAPPPECGDDADTASFAICGQLVGKDPGTLFTCSNHHLTVACKCQSDCEVAAHGSSCDCDGGEPGTSSNGGDGTPTSCSKDGDCNPGNDGSGQFCSGGVEDGGSASGAGVCVPGCHTNAQCPGTTECSDDGQCE